ncbi:hypothetical protein GA0115261_111111, partial [Streptomyces sp. OspMP-M43]
MRPGAPGNMTAVALVRPERARVDVVERVGDVPRQASRPWMSASSVTCTAAS